MNKKIVTSILLIGVLSTGCISIGGKDRNWFGDNTVGADVDTARTTVEAILNEEETARETIEIETKAETIEDKAEEIIKVNTTTYKLIEKKDTELALQLKENFLSIEDYATAVAKDTLVIKENVKTIKENNKANVAILTDINTKAQGKKVISKSKLMLYWFIGISGSLLLFGVAIRSVPFLQPVNRIVCGVMNLAIDMGSGLYEDLKKSQLEHLDKTNTIPTEKLPKKIQKKIIDNRE